MLNVDIAREYKILPLNHPQREKTKNFVSWMNKMNARTTELKFDYLSETNRGIVAANDFDEGEEVLFIPDDGIISQFRARSIEWSKRLIDFGFDEIA